MLQGIQPTDRSPKKVRQSHNNKVPPDAPRRNLSSFVMFANARRKEIKERFPGRSFPDIQSDISGEWAQMDDDSKRPWITAMTVDKERYKREMGLYRKHGPHWVWVVGHRMRQDLGLTDEDCTELNWGASAISDLGVDVDTRAGGRIPRSSTSLDDGLILTRNYDTERDLRQGTRPRRESCRDNFLGTELSCTNSPREFAIEAPSSKPPQPSSPQTHGPIQHGGSEHGSQVPFDRSWDAEWPRVQNEVEIFSPSVFDSFGLDSEWVDNYGYRWGDQ
ncbi:hypothetical protein DRE_02237 [Drechslerella stenobrocha 248]|uniref:HMG box domain-containing protein n=1 Tax=Drechslerella stenobrocha 248 TaxID=1043628 RepID=W7I866_9PEZI|nr:hypothetical protein DRE_02237 [Drechslerella stenobrocha 248]